MKISKMCKNKLIKGCPNPLQRHFHWNVSLWSVVFVSFSVLLVLFSFGCGDDRPTIDLNKNTGSNNSSPPEAMNSKATMRVAISAMLSPEITREYYQRLMELVAHQLDRRAIFSQRRTYAEVNKMVETREVDVALVCSGPYTKGHHDFGMEILVVPVVHGRKVYYSYFISNRDSKIKSFSDLRGCRFAFTDPDSNTGFLVPNYMLAIQGETPDSYFGEVFFTYSHDNSIKAVANGLADGAAVDSLIWEFMDANDPSDTSRTQIIETSPPYGIPPVVIHPDLDEHFKQRLKSAFLSIQYNDEAAELLRKIQIDGFAEGDDSMYESVSKMQNWIENLKKENTK